MQSCVQCAKQFRPRPYQAYRQLVVTIYPFTQRNFCSSSRPSVSLRSRDADASKAEEQQRKQQVSKDEESIIHRRREEEYNKQLEVLKELQELKKFIEDNADAPSRIVERLKHDINRFDASKTTALHRCESMRRIIWLCSKYLTDEQWYDLAISDELEQAFLSFSQLFLDHMQWLTVEELCDILWTYATLGFRPSQLMARIVSKIDRTLHQHKKDYFGYKRQETGSNAAEETNYKAETLGYVPGSLHLPCSHNEFADLMYSYGCLRIESGTLISLLDAVILEHYPEKQYDKFRAPNRLLDGFLPRDLSNLCIGYAMMDPAFHWYKIVWGLNRHLNILSNYVKWSYHEKLNILHYDVCMRYINVGWKLSLNGEMAKLIDENFVQNIPRLVPPFHDKMNQEIYDVFCEQVVSDQYFCKNIEGFQIPFSRWEPRDEPVVIDPLNKLQFTRLDDVNNNKLLLGRALLKQNVLKTMFDKNYRCIPYWEWPTTHHLQHLLLRKIMQQLEMPMTTKHNLLQHSFEPHYQALHKGVYD